MTTVNLIFSMADTPWPAKLAGEIIKLVTWSSWSHVEIETDEYGTLIGSAPASGVAYATLRNRLSTSSKVMRMSVACSNEQKAQVLNFLQMQLGKPYDFYGVLGLGLHREWQKDDRWFCSELVAAALVQAGLPVTSKEFIQRITPQRVYELPYVDRTLLKG